MAIDGPAASGKGTVARSVAEHFGFEHLDTGLLYRAVGAKVQAGADAVEAARSLTREDLESEALRTSSVAKAASRVAAIAEVRAALLDFQRAFARRSGGAVLDGRDIGTVIAPYADVKLFITASPETRARRRWLELSEKGFDITEPEVLEDILARDQRDLTRDAAPLTAAADAVLLDTSEMSIEQSIQFAIDQVNSKRSE